MKKLVLIGFLIVSMNSFGRTFAVASVNNFTTVNALVVGSAYRNIPSLVSYGGNIWGYTSAGVSYRFQLVNGAYNYIGTAVMRQAIAD